MKPEDYARNLARVIKEGDVDRNGAWIGGYTSKVSGSWVTCLFCGMNVSVEFYNLNGDVRARGSVDFRGQKESIDLIAEENNLAGVFERIREAGKILFKRTSSANSE